MGSGGYVSQATLLFAFVHNDVNSLSLRSTWPEDLYRAACMEDENYGELDLTDRDTSL